MKVPKLIKENQYDQPDNYSAFEVQQDGGKQISIAIMVCDLANWWRYNFKQATINQLCNSDNNHNFKSSLSGIAVI